MTSTTAHAGNHIATKTAAVALAAAVLAAGAGYDPHRYAGTDREVRSFQHRFR